MQCAPLLTLQSGEGQDENKKSMKFLQIFNKTPNYKKFNYNPRFYNPEEEEMKERISRIQQEINASKSQPDEPAAEGDNTNASYRERIHGSFAKARRANGNPPAGVSTQSPALLRMGIILILTVGFLGYLQYGLNAIYGIALVLIPIYLYMRFRKLSDRGR
jgi:hypothetical protein